MDNIFILIRTQFTAMAPNRGRVIARIPASGSAPAVEVLSAPRSKESEMPSFCSKPPIIDTGKDPGARVPRSIMFTETNASDSICPNLSTKGVGRNAYKMFEILRVLHPEPSESAFRADSAGLFWGEKKVGEALNLSGECPTLKVWMDWLYSYPGSRAKNLGILQHVPLSGLANTFDIGEIREFMLSFSSTQYASITADLYSIRLELYEQKSKPGTHSFKSKVFPFF